MTFIEMLKYMKKHKEIELKEDLYDLARCTARLEEMKVKVRKTQKELRDVEELLEKHNEGEE